MRLDDKLILLEEFERSAESRRRKAVELVLDDERHFDEERRKVAERKEEEHQRLVEEIAATSEQVSRFHERLDRYDAGVVHALMDNRQALDHADDALADIRRRATVLPDGRRIYRTEDGQHVFDESGGKVGQDVVDPKTISSSAPSWERFHNAGEAVRNLTIERDGLLAYQERVDHARERAGRDGVTQAELKALGDDLDRAMPAAVRRKTDGPSREGTLDGLPPGPQFGPNDAAMTIKAGMSGRLPAPG